MKDEIPEGGQFDELLDELRVRIVDLEPEDVIVIESRKALSPESRQFLCETFEKHLPGIRAMVLDNDLTLRGVLRKAEAMDFPTAGE